MSGGRRALSPFYFVYMPREALCEKQCSGFATLTEAGVFVESSKRSDSILLSLALVATLGNKILSLFP